MGNHRIALIRAGPGWQLEGGRQLSLEMNGHRTVLPSDMRDAGNRIRPQIFMATSECKESQGKNRKIYHQLMILRSRDGFGYGPFFGLIAGE